MTTFLTILLTLFALQPPAPVRVRLEVTGGKGTGVYECGTKIKIEAPKKHRHIGTNSEGEEFKSETDFAGWVTQVPGPVSIENPRDHKTTVTIACVPGLESVRVDANYGSR